MAKSIGLIGNFRGKVGNMVGYNLKDSNNKQTQGVRVYQPVVKNPKSYAQAEQRAKLAPINATYRALKAVIDRGQESKAYGNKSRLAWLKSALKSYNGTWFEKGSVVNYPVLVELTKGSLATQFTFSASDDRLTMVASITAAGDTPTVGEISTGLIAKYPLLKDGDQITFVAVGSVVNGGLISDVRSFIVDSTSTTAADDAYSVDGSNLVVELGLDTADAVAVICSREGDGGQHLRNTVALKATSSYPESSTWDASKELAIQSYMAGGVSSDWPEEQIPRV